MRWHGVSYDQVPVTLEILNIVASDENEKTFSFYVQFSFLSFALIIISVYKQSNVKSPAFLN